MTNCKLAYSITPNNQPIIKDNIYYCKYCGEKVEPELVMLAKIGWMHKHNGKKIDIDNEIRDTITISINRHKRNQILHALELMKEMEPSWNIDTEFNELINTISEGIDTL